MIIDIMKIFPFFLILICIFAMPGIFNFVIVIPLLIIMFICFYSMNLQTSNTITAYLIKKDKTTRILAMFVMWMFLSYIVNFIISGYSFSHFLLTFSFGYFFNFIACFLLGIFVANFISTKTLIKVLTLALMIILFFAMIEIITFLNHIPGLENFIALSAGRTPADILQYKYEGFPRIQSFFNEPSHFAWFLTCNIPIVLTIARSKFKIFTNLLFNKFVKITILPLWLTSLIYTQSAIFLIFSCIIFYIYYVQMLRVSKKMFLLQILMAFTILLGFIFIITTIDISDTYLRRIVSTLQSFGNFQIFAIVEPSLATRIIHWVNMFIISIHHPIFGISCGNLENYFPMQLMHSPLPYTKEVLIADILTNQPRAVLPSIFFRTLADNGFVGSMIFYTFLFSIYNNSQKLYTYNNTFCEEYFKAVSFSILIFIVLTIYDSQLYNHYFWVMFGIVTGIYIKERLAFVKGVIK